MYTIPAVLTMMSSPIPVKVIHNINIIAFYGAGDIYYSGNFEILKSFSFHLQSVPENVCVKFQ